MGPPWARPGVTFGEVDVVVIGCGAHESRAAPGQAGDDLGHPESHGSVRLGVGLHQDLMELLDERDHRAVLNLTLLCDRHGWDQVDAAAAATDEDREIARPTSCRPTIGAPWRSCTGAAGRRASRRRPCRASRTRGIRP
jgi:hypothetical protein